MKEQTARLRRVLEEKEIDVFLGQSPLVRRYLSGFTGSNGFAAVSRDHADLLTDFRYFEQAAKEAPDFQLVKLGRDYHLSDYLRERGYRRAAIEENCMTAAEYRGLCEKAPRTELVYGAELVNRLRQIKTPEEIELHRKSCEMTNRIVEEFFRFAKVGMTEIELNDFILSAVRRHGADSCFFDPITLTGPNSAMCHGKPSERKLEEGDFLLLDMGVNYKGYASDVTRTAVMGEAGEKQKEIYRIVLEAHMKAFREIRAGMTAFEADKIARDVITEAGYGECFQHALGHGFHDGLVLRNDHEVSDAVLKENMIFTIEPGIYIPGLGGVRIEDDVLLTEKGCVSFCTYTKELVNLQLL